MFFPSLSVQVFYKTHFDFKKAHLLHGQPCPTLPLPVADRRRFRPKGTYRAPPESASTCLWCLKKSWLRPVGFCCCLVLVVDIDFCSCCSFMFFILLLLLLLLLLVVVVVVAAAAAAAAVDD